MQAILCVLDQIISCRSHKLLLLACVEDNKDGEDDANGDDECDGHGDDGADDDDDNGDNRQPLCSRQCRMLVWFARTDWFVPLRA